MGRRQHATDTAMQPDRGADAVAAEKNQVERRRNQPDHEWSPDHGADDDGSEIDLRAGQGVRPS